MSMWDVGSRGRHGGRLTGGDPLLDRVQHAQSAEGVVKASVAVARVRLTKCVAHKLREWQGPELLD